MKQTTIFRCYRRWRGRVAIPRACKLLDCSWIMLKLNFVYILCTTRPKQYYSIKCALHYFTINILLIINSNYTTVTPSGLRNNYIKTDTVHYFTLINIFQNRQHKFIFQPFLTKFFHIYSFSTTRSKLMYLNKKSYLQTYQ